MKYLPLLGLLILSLSCTKKEIIREIEHTNVVVEGNTPPYYNGVSTLQVQSYINKYYIDLLGREPSDQELINTTNNLQNNGLSLEARTSALINLQSTPVYYRRFYEIYSSAFLGNFNPAQVQGLINFLTQQKQIADQQGDIPTSNFLQQEINKLTALQTVAPDYAQGNIDLNQFFATLVNNAIYDEVNMGTENFVIACFENLFKRLPTDQEKAASINMVDGGSSQVLLMDGNSKGDFINIMTSVANFYEGLTIEVYRQLLARDPNSVEMAAGILELTNTKDYAALQRKVILTEEYAGF